MTIKCNELFTKPMTEMIGNVNDSVYEEMTNLIKENSSIANQIRNIAANPKSCDFAGNPTLYSNDISKIKKLAKKYRQNQIKIDTLNKIWDEEKISISEVCHN